MLGSQSDMAQVTKEKQPCKEKASSREIMVAMNTMLSKMELVVAEGREQFDDGNHRIEGLESKCEEFRKEMQGALNIATSICLDHVKSLEETLQP